MSKSLAARLVVAVALLLPAAPAPAETPAPDPRAVAARVAADFARPRYAALAAATRAQEAAWRGFCARRGAAGVAALKAAFAAADDAWAAVELVRFGPVSDGTRYERFGHWPERRNAIGRGLAALLAGKDPADLEPARLREASTAVQGFDALERVLHDPDAAALAAPGPAGDRRCTVGAAIAAGLAGEAGAVAAAWADAAGPVAAGLAEPEAAREALGRIATDALAMLTLVEEQKLLIPLGKTPEEAKPAAARMARSGRAGRVVAVNLAAVEALARLLLDPGREDSAPTLAALETARSVAESMPADLTAMVADPKRRSRVVLLRSAVLSARELAATAIPASLGVTVGFNSLDGD